MAPSMAANLNPQPTAGLVGRAVPAAFFLAAVGVLLVSYGFVRLCQYYQHSGSVYAFVGLTLGPRTGVVSGLALFATYTFYGVVTSSAAGILGTDFLDKVGIWNSPPDWAPFLIAAIALVGCAVADDPAGPARHHHPAGDRGDHRRADPRGVRCRPRPRRSRGRLPTTAHSTSR